MAYNFRNALVNLNEEIRKSGGGGGDLPAVKQAVSQLQVSMYEVKASVANVSAEVDRIKDILMSFDNSETYIGTYGDLDYYRRVFRSTDSVTLNNGAKYILDPNIKSFVTAEGSMVFEGVCFQIVGEYYGVAVWADITNGLYIWNRGNQQQTFASYDIIVTYTKPSTRKKEET